MWADVVDVQVGVAGDGVNAVLVKVFTDVLRGGLRQQPVNALPEEGTRPWLPGESETCAAICSQIRGR